MSHVMGWIGFSLLADGLSLAPEQRGWIALGVAGICIAYLLFRPKMRKKPDPLERPASFGSLSQQRVVERQMQNLLVELSEMARQISAQIDTRVTKLELLIKEADEKLAAMQAAQRQPLAASRPSGRDTTNSPPIFHRPPLAVD